MEETASKSQVAGAVAMVEALVPEDDGSAESAMREKLGARYNTVRPFLSLLGESNALGAATGGRKVRTAPQLGGSVPGRAGCPALPDGAVR